LKLFYKRLLIGFIVIEFLNLSCEKEKKPEIDIFKEYSQEIFNSSFLSIYGDWELKESSGGWTGGYRASFSDLKIYEIGKFKLIKDEEILSEGKVVIDIQTDTSLFISFYPYMYIPGGSKNVTLKGNDSLYLDDFCCDGYSYFFIRKE
jgi:hypothetical protein